MTEQSKAQRLATLMENWPIYQHMTEEAALDVAAELRRLEHNNKVLMQSLFKAHGDDAEAVQAILNSQGELL